MPAEPGGVGIFQPEGKPAHWSGSFSGLPLCADNDAVGDLQIVGVKVLETFGSVDDFEAFVAERDQGARGDLLFVSAHGRAPSFKEDYATRADQNAPYDYRDLSNPTTISGDCADPASSANLVLTFNTDEDGGLVKSWEVLYESDGQAYTSGPVHWEVWLCGSALDARYACE